MLVLIKALCLLLCLACTYFIFSLPLSILGKRLGRAMGMVAKEVKAMSQADILAFEKSGEVNFSGHCLRLTDIKVRLWHFNPSLHLL